MSNSMSQQPLPLIRRPRRNRLFPSLRDMVQETWLRPSDFIQPLFVRAGTGDPEPIASMPGQFRWTLDGLLHQAEDLCASGVRGIALFPQVAADLKDTQGSYSSRDEAWPLRVIEAIRREVPDLLVIADVALDPYTSHGHDGILDASGHVDNDQTVHALSRLAVLQAQAGAQIVAPSDMMDGRILAIRKALDSNALSSTGVMAYSAKFASSYYGPFRDAVGSATAAGTCYLDKRTYQLNPANAREALVETMLDEQEGADILMVKPAGLYLDIIARVRQSTLLPLAAYQISGEYAQIHAAAERGWLDLEKARDESLIAIKRAGADIILTYFAGDVAKMLQTKGFR
ncbi:porphobilinogen synthase [Verrucomicrobia bacterium LW23]|nr:porphobilinogen synthase [Verrucomicrobia bacterium LW23]